MIGRPSSSELLVLTNPLPHQGYLASQPTQCHATPQPSQSVHHDYHILMTNSNDVNTKQVNLKIKSRQYVKSTAKSPNEFQPQVSTEFFSLSNGSL